MNDKTIKIREAKSHRTIELSVNDIVDLVPSIRDGYINLVTRDYMRYRNRKTHCQVDKWITVKKSALKKAGIYKVWDYYSHRSRVVCKGEILAIENHEDGPFKGKFNLTLDRPHVYTAHDWVKIMDYEYIGEQDFDRIVVGERTVKKLGYKAYPNIYVHP